jgi:predicted Fe-Mo cluster-binding NifX family protein
MKIAITSKGKDLDAEMDPRFGRAVFFIVYDTDDGSFSVIDNKKNLDAERGVGVQAGQTVVDAGAGALITGNCGPKAYRVLNTAGVKVYTGAEGTVQEGIEAYNNGTLTAADSANVEGHWM